SALHWTHTKKRLGFCKVTQDGDNEGCLRLFDLPTPDQAEIIRDVLGIQKRREVSAEVLERLKAFAFERKPGSKTRVDPNIGRTVSPAPEVPPEKTAILDAEPAE